MLKEVGTLENYLGRYGALLGQAAREKLNPLHIPARDVAHVANLLRSPFDPQAHCIAAGVKLFRDASALLMVGECGTGKTLMGQAMAHTHAGGRPYRGLVFCPPHLPDKWKRELEETLPGVRVHIVTSYRDLVRLRNRKAPKRPTWYVLTNSIAKLGNPWRASYITRPRIAEEGIAHCPDCWEPIMEFDRETERMLPVPISDLEKRKHECDKCGAQLWQHERKYDRHPAAHYIHKQLKGVFKYLIVDEVHEEKGDDTAQANALGALCGTPYIAALTGTLIGGYADHLRTLLFRLAPRSLVEEGFGWTDHMPFNEKYGRIETKIVEKEKKSKYSSLRTSRGGSRTKTKYVRPGIMPTFFGRHLIDKTIFLALEEVADNLPELQEEVIGVELDKEQRAAYEPVEEALSSALKDMVAKGDKRLLGAMLQTLLCYPDKPTGWPMIGYWDTGKDGQGWVDVVQPPDLDEATIRPKEAKIIADVLAEKAEGRQAWIFTVMTDKRDVCERLAKLLEARGLKVAVLRAKVKTRDRETWIAKHGPTVDVVLCHPQLVQTGLDLFDKGGAYNFATLMFYLAGYNTFTLRQASRRAWRIGQHLLCKVKYYYYKGTMQERAMELIGKKLSAAEAIEGKFSAEGLAAMAGEEGSAEMALARSLVNRIGNTLDAARAWKRVTARPPRQAAQPMSMGAEVVHLAEGTNPGETAAVIDERTNPVEEPVKVVQPRRFAARPMPGAEPARQLSLFGDVA